MAAPLYDAGLRRINVHLDTLDRERFLKITRRDELERVLAGIEEARRLGFGPIKINAVAVKDLVEPDIVPLARFGRENGFEVRYIEFMPLDAQELWDRVEGAPGGRDPGDAAAGDRAARGDPGPGSARAGARIPLRRRRRAGGLHRFGEPPFCLNCNRIRLTADGKLRYCLFAIEETDVKGLLRGGAADEEIAGAIRRTVAAKWEGHEINTERFVAPPRPMYSIGG